MHGGCAFLLFTLFVLISISNAAYDWSTQRGSLKVAAATGCCNDRVECRTEKMEFVYMGIDALVKTEKAANNLTGKNGIVLGKVEMNAFYKNLFMVIDRINDYNIPSISVLAKYPSEEDEKVPLQLRTYNEDCIKASNSKSLATAALLYKDTMYGICDQYVIQRDLSQTPKNVKLSFSEACKQVHPLFCDTKRLEDLIDIAVIPESEDSVKILVFRGPSQVAEPTAHKRAYSVEIWNDAQMEKEDKIRGFLSSVDIYAVEKGVVRGIYATNDGNVCGFKYTQGSKLYIVEKLDPRPVCVSMQTYIGCPQPWCFDHQFGASFTIADANGQRNVYFIQNFFFWKVPETRVPLSVPEIEKAVFAGDSLSRLCYESYAYNADGQNHLPCVHSWSQAAFAVKTSQSEFVFMYYNVNNRNLWGWAIVTNKTAKDQTEYDQVFKKGPADPTAAWFNENEMRVYLFAGRKYKSYNFEDKGLEFPEWTHHADGTVADFGLPNNFQVENVVKVRAKVYFFDEASWYYEVDQKSKKAEGEKKLSWQNFFRLRTECYHNDFQTYRELLQRHGISIEDRTYVEARGLYQEVSVTAPSEKSNIVVILIIIGCGIAVIGLVLLFVVGHTVTRRTSQRRIIKVKQKTVARKQPSRKRSSRR